MTDFDHRPVHNIEAIAQHYTEKDGAPVRYVARRRSVMPRLHSISFTEIHHILSLVIGTLDCSTIVLEIA